MSRAGALGRLVLVAVHLASGASIALYIVLLARVGRRPGWIAAVTRRWYRRLCSVLGLRIRVTGRPEAGCLLIGNHVSWLDIPVVGAQGEIGFLSKAEVRRWPLVGWMAELAGTEFIERGANRTTEISERLRQRIERGHSLMIFPEGTTTDGSSVLRFHPRLFALAQDTGSGVQPVAIAYRRDRDGAPDSVAPFIGDDTLVAHLMRVARHPGLVAEVCFLPPLAPSERLPRRVLADQTRSAIAVALGVDASPPPRRDRHVDRPSAEPPAEPISNGDVVHVV